jgi:hypothetical protein
MVRIKIVRCGDCGFTTSGSTPEELGDRGWKLLRLRDGFGNPVLLWRCQRCLAMRARSATEEAAR